MTIWLILTIAISASLILMNHRLYGGYVHAVSREERKSRRRWSQRCGERPDSVYRHIGPRCFLALDLAFIVAGIWALWRLGIFRDADTSRPFVAFAEASILFSGLVALWVLLEGRHLQVFYQHTVRAARELRGDARRLAWADSLLGKDGSRIRRWTIGAAVVWATMPLFLELLGYDLIGPRSSTEGVFSLFLVWFVLPQLVLGTIIARALLPVRRLLYRSS